ncbi:hypothetical protein COU18_01880 [Candidatus Kaiserbacteria bacterium CG10_big_fil_rev_8_21_14_0_10_51_14]|uniref:Type II toxin-antitoxin system RelE/ParE family toxin n=1 Tax=Candidatus Kaiserbacteria bacterium CG10_big_fil_rev_8_21_14_0_10_51_14 TaxID=1974610 RepID=A0A2H0UDM3_9BACT|nr:MAG: hypothetical protein COU18_01880 [Candidatus Kaiserbacteria bacterium CG10_big_fil_rev_8_21_14_0_10_51_14]
MAGRKKTFRCGHRGKGQVCHRCQQEARQRQANAQTMAKWNEKVFSAPVRVDHLPKEIAEKTLQIIAELKDGKPYLDFKGKRMVVMGQRDVISIPIGKRYRLICRDLDGVFEYVEVITHETYNNRLTAGGWN